MPNKLLDMMYAPRFQDGGGIDFASVDPNVPTQPEFAPFVKQDRQSLVPSAQQLKGAFERRVKPVITEAEQTALTGGILGDILRAYGKYSVPVNQAALTALGRPAAQEFPPQEPPEMTVPTAFERRGDLAQQLFGSAIGDPANLLDLGLMPSVGGAVKQAAKGASDVIKEGIKRQMTMSPMEAQLGMARVGQVQAPVSPLGFYNPVEQAALNVQRKQGPGQAFLKELQRGENVSKDFLQSSGLAERLAAMPNVTREEVQRMAKGSVPEVEEIVRGEQFSKAIEQEQQTAGQLVKMIDSSPGNTIRLQNTVGPVYSDEALYYLQDGTAKPEQFPEHLQELARQYVQLHQKAKTTENLPAIYNREDLILPGGENYREVLLKLPTNKVNLKIPDTSKWSVISKNVSPVSGTRQVQIRDDQGNLVGQRFGFIGSDQQAIDEVFYKYLERQKQIQREQSNYISSHWRDTPNVLSHIRMNDRTDAEGKKVLFIEELQSDWAQQGRKRGFGDKDAKIQDLVRQRDLLPDDSPEQEAIQQQINELGVQDKGVPSAPFVQNTKDWVDLSLKNILKRAVDEGYDRVAFINGKQSADRYNLSNYVSTIDWNPPSNRLQQKGANSFVKIYLHDGNPIELPLTREGKVLKNTGTQFDGKSLGDIVGEKVAQKIMASPYGTLAGEGLSVGGMGMKKFYDEIVPERVRKVLGKDTTLRQIQFEDPAAKLREELASATPGSSRYLYLTDKIGQLEREAERYGAVGNQLGFDITPEIRDKFSKPIPYKKGGSVRISNNPDTMRLELLRKKHA